MHEASAKSPVRVGIYCRLSYAPDGSVEKVERQEGDCRELGKRLGWPAPEDRHVYVDNSKSAWQRNRKRSHWDRMLRDIEANQIDGVLIYHGDRLIRQPYDLERLIGIADMKGVRLASPSGTRDLDNPDDRFILRIEAASACRESDNTSRRIRRTLAANVKVGKTQKGGRRPFGYGVPTGETTTRTNRETGEQYEVPVYDTDQLVTAEAVILEEAAERLLAGQSQGGVIAWMRTLCKTTEGGEWTARGLRHLLLAPRAAGLIEHEGVLYEAAWPGILSRETWEACVAYYRTSAVANPYQGRARKYVLSGVARCYKCGETMRTKPAGGRNQKNVRIYCCWNTNCRGVGRNQEHLDAYVSARTVRLLSSPALLDELAAAADRPDLAQEVAALSRRRDEVAQQIADLASHPTVNVGVALQGLASIEQRIQALRDQMAADSRQRLISRMAGISREQWDAEPVDVRSATITALWIVTVLPATWRGPGFHPDSVRMERVRPTSQAGAQDAEVDGQQA